VTKLIIGIGIVIALGAAWYFGSPLLIDKTVDEKFPETTQAPTVTKEPNQPLTEEEKKEMEEQMENAANEPDVEIVEEMPKAETEETGEALETEVAGPALVKHGEIKGADNSHQGSGTAGIYELADGSNILRLENFEVTNGPDLRVLLAKHTNPQGRSDLQEGTYIELDKLKGNKGNQNYNIPQGTNIAQYGSIAIYCKPFHVLFASASLDPVSGE
jgi:hypothetical protein